MLKNIKKDQQTIKTKILNEKNKYIYKRWSLTERQFKKFNGVSQINGILCMTE